MGRTQGPYNAEFPKGSWVQIADRPALDQLKQSWKYHHPLEEQQIDFAGKQARVREVSFYHGGDELYELYLVPGIWHEECLKPGSREAK